jgi:molybdopterin synthase catalytic subunit
MNDTRPSIEAWLDEVKSAPGSTGIGMLLVHNGVVRGTTRAGEPVQGMDLTYDRTRLEELVAQVGSMPGVIAVRAWVNEGRLAVGDDIMYALVAADIREHAFDGLKELVRRIKTEIVSEWEIR